MCDFYNDTCAEECYCKNCFIQVKTNYETFFIEEKAAKIIQKCWKNYKLKKKGIYVFESKTILIDYHYFKIKKIEFIKLDDINIIINFINKSGRKPYIMKKPRGLRNSYRCGVCGFFPKKNHICKGFFNKKLSKRTYISS